MFLLVVAMIRRCADSNSGRVGRDEFWVEVRSARQRDGETGSGRRGLIVQLVPVSFQSVGEIHETRISVSDVFRRRFSRSSQHEPQHIHFLIHKKLPADSTFSFSADAGYTDWEPMEEGDVCLRQLASLLFSRNPFLPVALNDLSMPPDRISQSETLFLMHRIQMKQSGKVLFISSQQTTGMIVSEMSGKRSRHSSEDKYGGQASSSDDCCPVHQKRCKKSDTEF